MEREKKRNKNVTFTGNSQTINGPSTITLEDIKKNQKKDEIPKEPSGGGVTSWNDLEDKPFYETIVTLIDDQTFTIDSELGVFVLSESQLIEEGNTYDVIYNGVEYKGLVASAYFAGGVSVIIVGNLYALSGGGDANIPFAAAYSPELGGTVLFSSDDVTECTLTIVGEYIKALDSKYLPKALRFGEKKETIFPTIELTFEENDQFLTALVDPVFFQNVTDGQPLSVTWGGTVYECTARVLNDTVYVGNLSLWGGDDTGEPFSMVLGNINESIVTENASILSLDGSSIQTVSVETVKVQTIDPKYLPVRGEVVIDLTYTDIEQINNDDDTINRINYIGISSPLSIFEIHGYIRQGYNVAVRLDKYYLPFLYETGTDGLQFGAIIDSTYHLDTVCIDSVKVYMQDGSGIGATAIRIHTITV